MAHDEPLPVPALLPDSPFYFVKVILRGIGNLFTFSGEAKIKRELAIAEEKLLEAHALFNKGKADTALAAVAEYEDWTARAKMRLEKVKVAKEDKSDPVLKTAEAAIAKHISILEEVLEKAPEAARQGLENAIENSGKVLEKFAEPDEARAPAAVIPVAAPLKKEQGIPIDASKLEREIKDFLKIDQQINFGEESTAQ